MNVAGNFDGFPLNRSIVWVGNIMTLVEWFQFFKSVSLANAWIALDWNGTNERWHASNSHAKTGNCFFFSEDRTSSADLETILGKDEEKEQGVCWLGFLEIPLVLGEAPPIDLCGRHASRFMP